MPEETGIVTVSLTVIGLVPLVSGSIERARMEVNTVYEFE